MKQISKEEITELCEGLGWFDMGEQRSQYLIAFQQEETGRRLDFYFTTMTAVLQDKRYRQRTYRDVKTLEALELLLTL